MKKWSPGDLALRHWLYRFFVERGRPPEVPEAAEAFGGGEKHLREAFQRLHDGHLLFLEPGSPSIRMAHPLSAIPTKFRVTVKDRSYWANCIWDAFGIPAMLREPGSIEAHCGDCDEPVRLASQPSKDFPDRGLAHFALPFRQWYEDLVFT